MSALRERSLPRRGFALALAWSVLLLLLVVVDMLQDSTVTDRVSTVYEVADIQADYIAEAGLGQVAAYLTSMGSQQPDFDLALDPGLNTTCTFSATYNNNAVTYGGTQTDDHLPAISGGSVTTDANPNLKFWMVPYGGGAFYVRVDDNSDDGHEGWMVAQPDTNYNPGNYLQRNNYFPLATNNREPGGPYWSGALTRADGNALACAESPTTEINQLRDNQARDRDKVVVVTAIGIYPGTVFSAAQARRSYRLLMSPARQNPVIAAYSDVTVGTGGRMCGAQGGVHANSGNITANNNCQCGDFSTTTGSTSPASLTACTTAQCDPAFAGCSPPNVRAGMDPLNIPPASADATAGDKGIWASFLMNDFKRTPGLSPSVGTTPDPPNECYFFMGRNGVAYFWDFNRPAFPTYPESAGNCNAFNGTTTPRPCGDPAHPEINVGYHYEAADHTNDRFCHCWIPVFYDTNPPQFARVGNNPAGNYFPNPYATNGVGVGTCDGAGYCPGGGGRPAPPTFPSGVYSVPPAANYLIGGTPPVVGGGPGACVAARDCSNSGQDRWQQSAAVYNFPAICGAQRTVPPTLTSLHISNTGVPSLWRPTNTTGIAPWMFRGNQSWDLGYSNSETLNDADVIDALYFMDAPESDRLDIKAHRDTVNDDYLTMGVITRGQIHIYDQMNITAPLWAPSWALVSGSSSNNQSGRSCITESNTLVVGNIVCKGKVELKSGAMVVGGLVSTNDDVVIGNNVDFFGNPGLRSWVAIPVKPVVWAEAAF